MLRSFDKVGQPLPRALPAPCFQLMPHKGKPCQLLLGRATQTLRQRWRLTAGDVFCVGHTHVSVQALTQRVAAPHGARLVLVHDRGRRYRRKALPPVSLPQEADLATAATSAYLIGLE